MKKSIALVAVFLAVFAVNATAGQLTVANTDITLAGGASATYNYVSDRGDEDNFNLDTAIIHLFKNASTDSPVGGHLAVGTFHVKTPTGVNVAPDIGYGEFSPWLGYVSWMPMENVTVDAGLLWAKFGEPPLSILNPNVTRPVAFLVQPVLFAGARIGVDTDMAKLYVGMNDGSALDHGVDVGNERAFEVGASADVGDMWNIAVNYFDHDEGLDTINASIGTEMGKFDLKLEANLVSADTEVADEDDATTYALYVGHQCADNFALHVRGELVDDNDSGIYSGLDGWNIAVTPTYKPTENSCIRLEVAYASDDNDIFADDDGMPGEEDTRYSAILECCLLF